MMKTLKELKSELLKDSQTLREYEALAEEFEVARELIAARARVGLTQADVAEYANSPALCKGHRLPGSGQASLKKTTLRWLDAWQDQVRPSQPSKNRRLDEAIQ
jgi:2-oxoglutarate dehydrogenase complex dehydrogenase (E1) component-like enzyme